MRDYHLFPARARTMSWELVEKALPSIIGSITGSFLGVFLGFLVNRWKQKQDDNRLRQEYVKGFRSEIGQGLGLLRNRKLQLVPSDLWMSAVNSGDLRLFCSDQKNDLRMAYFAISNYNYEAKRARDRGEQYRAEADDERKRQQLMSAWAAASEHAQQMGEGLIRTLENLWNKEWFKDIDSQL